jgi:hypothetical protein
MATKKTPAKGVLRERLQRLKERILRNVRVDDDTGCWLWTRRVNNNGYPVMAVRIKGRKNPVPMFAHRVSCELFNGPPPEPEHEAAHDVLCPFRHCCHPEHLRWATTRENAADRRHPSRLHVRFVPPAKHALGAAA